MNKKRIDSDVLTAVITVLFAFSFLLCCHWNTMLCFEQNTLFVFSQEHFIFSLKYFSFFNYLKDFFIQFFYYPLLGATVITVLCFLLMWFFKKAFGNWLFGAICVQAFLFTFQYTNVGWLLIGLGAAFIVFLISRIIKMSFRLPRIAAIAGVVCIAAMSCTNVFLLDKKLDRLHRDDVYAYQGQWNKIIEMGYDGAQNEMQPVDEDVLLSDYYKMALFFTQKGLDTIFSMPMPLFPFLYPQLHQSEKAIIRNLLARFYTENQMYSNALHILYDGFVAGNRSVILVKQIIETSIAAEDYRPAKKFISLFKKTLFYRKRALDYENKCKQIERRWQKKEYGSEDIRTDAYTPDKAIFTRYRQIENDNVLLSKAKGLFEYANTVLLLEKKLNTKELLREINNSRKLGYEHPPKALQQALLLADSSMFYAADVQRIVSMETWIEYENYHRQFTNFQQGHISMKTLQVHFGKNYFYFYNFISPKPITGGFTPVI